jgi:hypothetical protein
LPDSRAQISGNLPVNGKAARLNLSRNFADSLLHPDITGDGVFEREFDFVGEGDRHQPFLLHLDQAIFGDAAGGRLFALERGDRPVRKRRARLKPGSGRSWAVDRCRPVP